MPPDAIAMLATGFASVVGNIINNERNIKAQNTTNQLNTALTREVNQQEIDFAREQRDYNDPNRMVNRYINAGLNPNLVTGAQPTPAPTASLSVGRGYDAPKSSYQIDPLTAAQTANLIAQTENIEADTAKKESEIDSINLERHIKGYVQEAIEQLDSDDDAKIVLKSFFGNEKIFGTFSPTQMKIIAPLYQQRNEILADSEKFFFTHLRNQIEFGASKTQFDAAYPSNHADIIFDNYFDDILYRTISDYHELFKYDKEVSAILKQMQSILMTSQNRLTQAETASHATDEVRADIAGEVRKLPMDFKGIATRLLYLFFAGGSASNMTGNATKIVTSAIK